MRKNPAVRLVTQATRREAPAERKIRAGQAVGESLAQRTVTIYGYPNWIALVHATKRAMKSQ